MHIYIIDKRSTFTDEQLSFLESCGQLSFLESEKLDLYNQPYFDNSEEKIIAISPEFTDWKFGNEVIEKIPNLKAICLSTTSFDWVDGNLCKERNTVLTNVPYYSTNAVAEYITFLIHALARKLPLQIKNDFKCVYSDDMIQAEIKGKTLGIIGLGHIGNRTAEIGADLGMNVVYWSRNKRDNRFMYTELPEVLSKSDFICLTLAKNEGTTGLLTKELLMNIKKSACFITTSAEGIEDREFLIEQVENGNLGGLAFESENDKLIGYKGNVMITAPFAWYTEEALKNNIEIWTDTMVSICKGNPINVVN